VLTATQTTQYVVTVTDSGCAKTDSVEITVDHRAVVNAGPDKTIIQGQSVVLDGSISDTGVSFYWSPNFYMDNPLSLTPVVNPPADITYTLNIASGNVCGTSSDSVFVKVYDKVVIPNVFSPNGDGINDTWQIEALAAYVDADVSIFNRWGQPVFHSTGYARPWDGTYNGKPLPVATYYYIINLHNSMPVLSGWVAILR
jgi:gliding motility-associated-like protein